MKDSIIWMIRLGVILSITGLILIIISLLYHINLEIHGEWGENEFEMLFYRVYGIVGIVMVLVGISLYITGMRDLYFKPLKHLLYPDIKMNKPLKRVVNIKLPTIECKFCKEKIPLDSFMCPYCGGRQQKGNSIKLKS